MRVLIVDDDLTSRDMLSALLSKNGYDVITSESGEDAWRVMQNPEPPSIAILDWLMPGLDGLELCRLIRTLKLDLPTYIIMLTVKGRKDDIVAGLDTGADDYLSKPYDPGELRARVDVGRRMVILESSLKSRISELDRSRERFRSIVENANDIIYTLHDDGRFCYVSPNWTDILGHDLRDVVGRKFDGFVHPDDLESCYSFLEYVKRTGEKRSGIEYRVRHKDGNWRWHTSNGSLLNDSNSADSEFLGIARDITDRKADEERIKNLLTEKEILLREVHHRIKNNMGTVMSMLALQAEAITDPVAVAALADAESRIQSMMVLYDKLYRSVNFTRLSMNHYISTLVDTIIENYNGGISVAVEKEIEDFEISAELLQPLGIILNEIITNILKYAFTGRDNGEVKVSCSLNGERVTLSIHDNGNGMPDEIDFSTSSGFGLQLINLLSQQIGGCVRIERDNGTTIVLEFESHR